MEKSYDSIKLIGTLAVEKGWVSKEDVEFALAKQKTGKFFGEILLSKHLITIQQLDELLKLQQESEVRQEDFLFGQIAVHNRFIKAIDVINALEEQKANKFREGLGEIFRRKNLLNEQQCVAILASQKRIQKFNKTQNKKISCPKCKAFYQIKEAERYRKVRCKHCQYIFEVGTQNVKVFVDPIQPIATSHENQGEIESKSLIQFLKENDLTPQTNLSDSTNIIIKEDARYVIGNEIARGGMGSILMTKDVNLRRNIVTKVLLNKKSKLAILRFIEEAQITGQLEHPNIPPVYDLGVNKENNIFFTMKHIKGETLENVIKKLQSNDAITIERYSFTNLTNIFIKVCNALEFAHAKKVIHRDIKPENIMIGEYGEVLLMDWGLAKIIGTKEEFEELDEERVSSVRSEDESSNTIEGTTAGTPAFMSPEQATGRMEDLDQRADIYSLGATLYSVLALDRPVKGKNIQEILKNAANGNIEELTRIVPPELKAITLKALEFNPKHRYQTIKEMEKDLANYQMGYSVSAKQDNAIDIVRKFYLRNKLLATVSVIFFAIFIIGSVFFIISLQEQRNNALQQKSKAEEALKQFEQEKLERMADNKSSAPSLYTKAQAEAQMNRFIEAEKLMDTAISYDPTNQDYQLYRGCLAFSNNNLAKAKADLNNIKNHPYQKNISELLIILNTPNLKVIDERQKATISEICTNMKLFDIAQKQITDLTKKMLVWNKKLQDAWGHTNFSLYINNNKITFRTGSTPQADFAALKGIPVQSFSLQSCMQITNIAFLENMPLEDIVLYNCPLITDLSPLKNIKLKYAHFEAINAKDLNALSNAELKSLILRSMTIATLKPVLKQPIKELDFYAIKLTDINELKALNLEKLTLTYCPVNDLDFINPQQLKTLSLYGSNIKDISKLKNWQLETLELGNNPLADISPLQNKGIKILNLDSCRITDLEPLLTLKNLETLVITPSLLPPNWEQIISKMSLQLKQVGINRWPDSLKSADKFLAENKGFNIKNPKK